MFKYIKKIFGFSKDKEAVEGVEVLKNDSASLKPAKTLIKKEKVDPSPKKRGRKPKAR